MKPPRTYASPETFKQALEQRLRSSSKSGADFGRRRQLLMFDRFLARVVTTVGDAAMLKGGLVLELHLERARTANDVDLRMAAENRSHVKRTHMWSSRRSSSPILLSTEPRRLVRDG